MNLSDINNLDMKELAQAPNVVKGVLAGLIVLLIVVLGYYVDWSSALDSLHQAKREEQTLRQTYTIKKRQAINYQLYKQRLAETEKALAALLRQLPNKSEMSSLLTDINQTGIGRGLEFDLFRPGNEVKSDFYATLPVTIKVKGTYPDLGNFVSDVAKLPRIVTIHNITLEPDKGGELTMNATIDTYRYLDKSEMQQYEKAHAKGRRR